MAQRSDTGRVGTVRKVSAHALVGAAGFVGGVAWAYWQGIASVDGSDAELKRISELKKKNAELKEKEDVADSFTEAFADAWELADE